MFPPEICFKLPCVDVATSLLYQAVRVAHPGAPSRCQMKEERTRAPVLDRILASSNVDWKVVVHLSLWQGGTSRLAGVGKCVMD